MQRSFERLLSLPIKGEGTVIPAVDVLRDYLDGREHCMFIADADIDCDGVRNGLPYNPDHDRYYQPRTSLRYQGDYLDAYAMSYGVLPPGVIKACRGTVLGCLMRITKVRTQAWTWAVCGDIGPTFKLGEISPAAAIPIGVNPSPVSGGEDDYGAILYEFWPGVPAAFGPYQFQLQPYEPSHSNASVAAPRYTTLSAPQGETESQKVRVGS